MSPSPSVCNWRHGSPATRPEWEAAREFLGAALWRAVDAVVLHGSTVKQWAASVDWDEKVALGLLVGALTRLVEFYGLLASPSR